MLTHKQAWRRQKRSRSADRNLQFDAMKLQESLPRSISLPNFCMNKKPLDCAPKYHTTGSLNRTVRFSDNSNVVLIPCRDEYKKHGLLHEIWWEPDDYTYFKASARLEVMDLLEKFGG